MQDVSETKYIYKNNIFSSGCPVEKIGNLQNMRRSCDMIMLNAILTYWYDDLKM